MFIKKYENRLKLYYYDPQHITAGATYELKTTKLKQEHDE